MFEKIVNRIKEKAKQVVQVIATSKLGKALAIGAAVTTAGATTVGATPIVLDFSDAAPGFTTGDLLANAGLFLVNYWPYVLLVLAIVFSKALVNFIFFIVGKVRSSRA